MESIKPIPIPREKLSARVPGYAGYESPENRLGTDKRWRGHIWHDLKKSISLMVKPAVHLDPKATVELEQSVIKTQKKLQTLSDSLKRPTYRGASFFRRQSLPIGLLEEIYQHEATMINDLTALSFEVQHMRTVGNAAVIQDHLFHIKNLIDRINQLLFEREALILDSSD